MLLPDIIVLDVDTALNATWQHSSSSSSSSNAHHGSSSSLATNTTISCGGRRIRIVRNNNNNNNESSLLLFPVVRLTLSMPTAAATKMEEENEYDWMLHQRAIFIRGIYSIPSHDHDEALYRTTTLDLSWKPDNNNKTTTTLPPTVPVRSTKSSNHSNTAVEPEAEPEITYQELLKQQNATAHHEPRGQRHHAFKIEHVKLPNQHEQQQQQQQHAHTAADKVADSAAVKKKKKKDIDVNDKDKVGGRQKDLLATLHDAKNAPPRALEEPPLVERTLPDRKTHLHSPKQHQHHQHHQQQASEHYDGQGGSLLRRRFNHIFKKDASTVGGNNNAHNSRRTATAAAAAAHDPVEAFVHGKDTYFWGMAIWIVGMLCTIQGCRTCASRRHGGNKGRRDL
jgi:hypothetical protein